MKVVIQLSAREELRALPILFRHSPGTILPNRTYVIEETAARALRDAGITFKVLGSEANAPNLEGAGAGHRI